MPIYEYRCEACGKITDILLLKNSDRESIVCKHCGSRKLKKLVSKPAAVIIGNSHPKGTTCCGRTDRCDSPPCSEDTICKRD
jgi:putative FmdB family regulatory protein